MNLKPLAAMLLAITCSTFAAPTEDQQMKTMCGNIARINAGHCYQVAAPTAKDQQSRVFVFQVCAAAAREAMSMCLDRSTWLKYGALPGCAGVRAFTRDVIASGGAKAAAQRPEPERAKRREQADAWAYEGAVNAYKACMHDQSEEDRRRAGPFNDPGALDL